MAGKKWIFFLNVWPEAMVVKLQKNAPQIPSCYFSLAKKYLVQISACRGLQWVVFVRGGMN